MSMYDNMLPANPKQGYRGYYPVTSKEEWEELPDIYKAMEWTTVNDPFKEGEKSVVKNVIFDVVFLRPYKVSAKVYVHRQEVQKILFCGFKDTPCPLYSVCGIELESGTRVPAKLYQDPITGAFCIYSMETNVGIQGGYYGHVPPGIVLTENGYKYTFEKSDKVISHYELCNPFNKRAF